MTLKMETLEVLPESIQQTHRSLQPFIKERQEASRVRRSLAAQLCSHMSSKDGLVTSQPLSLVGAISSVDPPSSGVRGARKEYLKSLRANINAQKEYESIRREHLSPAEQLGTVQDVPQEDVGIILESFLEVVKHRRKHERLRIIQDYVDMLAQKPAATASHLDPKLVLKDVESLPKVPQEVMNSSAPRHDLERADPKDLVSQLEKSVLRAKLLLKKEQKLLAKLKAAESEIPASSVRQGGRLQALGIARNELINWIETELGKAGENSVDSNGYQDLRGANRNGKEYVESQLELIHRHYSQYKKARQALLLAATGKLPPLVAPTASAIEIEQSEKFGSSTSGAMSHILYPYLEQLSSISNEQKSIIQQKSHLAVNLAKQLKEAGQGLDRLAHESHLLPVHSTPANSPQRKGPVSFGNEISNLEKPDSTGRARAWVYASESASLATLSSISDKLEEGEISTGAARKALLELQGLVGEEVREGKGTATDEGSAKPSIPDIWGSLDGQLGAIQTDDLSSA